MASRQDTANNHTKELGELDPPFTIWYSIPSDHRSHVKGGAAADPRPPLGGYRVQLLVDFRLYLKQK